MHLLPFTLDASPAHSKSLIESGLSHSAFTFSTETQLASLPPDLLGHKIPRGELIRWLHRGLLWREVECHVGEVSRVFLPFPSSAFLALVLIVFCHYLHDTDLTL